tara:strand:+ start:939 stop:1154 length:216 start_codon:yes stop_codon:yes gene_type:complete
MNKQTVAELVERLTKVNNEIKLLQEDRRELLADYKEKLDIRAFKAAMRITKMREEVDEAQLDNILLVMEDM